MARHYSHRCRAQAALIRAKRACSRFVYAIGPIVIAERRYHRRRRLSIERIIRRCAKAKCRARLIISYGEARP